MKKFCLRLASVMMFSLLLITISGQKAHAQDAMVSYQTFYDELAPYGQWVDDPYYGNVFVPNVEPGFRPYATDGHWAMTEYGNMWMSDAPWAWACYHYGRWTYNNYYGWLWVPGYKWAPAWVSWRSGDGYYGWAPMAPGYRVGGAYEYPDNYWVFVTPQYLYEPNVYNYYGRENASVYIGRTTYLNETYAQGESHYYYGPRREIIESETHRPVEVYRVSDARQPGAPTMGGRNEVSIYRPAMDHGSATTARPANVVRGESHPIERTPQAIAPEHGTSQPAFRQEHPQMQQQQRPQQQEHQQPQQEQRPQQFQQQPRQQEQEHQQPQQQPRPQQQQFQQQPRQQEQEHQQPQQQPRPQQQQFQQQPRQQEQEHQQPQQQPRPQQQQPQQQQRPQQQQTQQQQRPPQQQKPAQQQKPQQQKAEHERK